MSVNVILSADILTQGKGPINTDGVFICKFNDVQNTAFFIRNLCITDS